MFTVHGRNSDNTWFLQIEIVPPFKITDFNTPNTTEIFYFTSSPVTLSRTRQQRHEVIENLGSLFMFTVNENFSQFASQYLVILLLKLRT